MAAQAPTPLTWTLKFKRDKTTIALFAQPDQSITTIKETFLEALKARGITQIDGQSVPTSLDEITFAKLRTPNDLSSGWEVLRSSSVSRNGETEVKSSKKKRPSAGGMLDSPVGHGLKDSAVLAFKFRKPDDEDENGIDVDDDDLNVTFPSLDVEEPDQLVP